MKILNTFEFIINHPMNKGKIISSLYRFFRWQIHSKIKDEIIFNWISNSKLIVKNGMTGATGNIYCGLHEYRDMALLLHILSEEDVFVDIGANIGSYTVLASAVCRAKSVAIEPDKGTAQRLARNVEINAIDDLVEMHVTALGSDNGHIRFTVGQDTINRVASDEEKEFQIVPITRLDDLLEGMKPTLIKIDTEGFETEVLKGSKKTLQCESLLAIIIETVDEEAHEILINNGFSYTIYDPKTKTFDKNINSFISNSIYIRNISKIEKKISNKKFVKWNNNEI